MRTPLKLCIVTPDLLGPIRNGGIGTATAHIAGLATELGWEVTILFTVNQTWLAERPDHWQQVYMNLGIRLEFLERVVPEYPSLPFWPECEDLKVSFLASEYLRKNHFDAVMFSDWRGHLYCSGVLKKYGFAFKDTVLVTIAHGTQLWSLEGSDKSINSLPELTTIWLERQSISLSDKIIVFNQYMIDWLKNNKFIFSNSVIRKLGFSYDPDGPVARQMRKAEDATNKVSSMAVEMSPEDGDLLDYENDGVVLSFFGRLETRKGVPLFCDALDRIARLRASDSVGDTVNIAKVRFIGKVGTVDGVDAVSYILERSTKWPFPVQLLVNRSHPSVMEILAESEGIVVIPSQSDNYPLTIVEAVRHDLCVVAANVGGVPEIFSTESQAGHLFNPHPKSLVAAIEELVRAGRPIPQLAYTHEEACNTWARLFAELKSIASAPATQQNATNVVVEEGVSTTLKSAHDVTVVILHRNRPRLLRQALAGLRRQDAVGFRVVIVDDGSDDPEALYELKRLEQELSERGDLVVYCDDVWLGAARLFGSKYVTSEYMIFIDDDNVPMPEMVSTFVAALNQNHADLVLCGALHFEGPDCPWSIAQANAVFIPLGEASPLSSVANYCGDANLLVKKSVFDALGGFSQDFMVGSEDWDFIVRASSGGYFVCNLPIPLYYKRSNPDSVATRVRWSASIVRPMMSARHLAGEIAAFDAVNLLHGLHWRQSQRDQVDRWYRERLSFHLSVLLHKFNRNRVDGDLNYTDEELSLAAYSAGQFSCSLLASPDVINSVGLGADHVWELERLVSRVLSRGDLGEKPSGHNSLSVCFYNLVRALRDEDGNDNNVLICLSEAISSQLVAEAPNWIIFSAALRLILQGELWVALGLFGQIARKYDAFYLLQNEDVNDGVRSGWFASGLEHYFLAGRQERRKLSSDRPLLELVPQRIRRQIASMIETRVGGSYLSKFLPLEKEDLRTIYLVGLGDKLRDSDDAGFFWGCDMAYRALEAAYTTVNADVASGILKGKASSSLYHYICNGRFENGRVAQPLSGDTSLAPKVRFDSALWLAIEQRGGGARSGWGGPLWCKCVSTM